MKKNIVITAAILSGLAVVIYSAFSAPAKKMPCPKCFVMHPEILPLDSAGNRVYNMEKFSSERTCGECHNSEFINGHNSHYNDRVRISCVECHVEGGAIQFAQGNINPDGTIKKDSVKIRVPSDDNCLRCHGVGGTREKTVFIPDDFPGSPVFVADGKCFRVTCKTGEILSPENISDSQLNIKGRDKLEFPWDIHLQREVACVSCHFTRNDPRRSETRRSDQVYLANDPRKSYSIGKYLYIPDHNLVHADCRSCHTPEKKHDFLPYKTRHFAVLSCQSCHVPRLYGPAFKSVDETVVTPGKTPRYEYRGVAAGDGVNLNTAYNEGYEPFLVSHNEEKTGSAEITGIRNGVSPVNFITRWSWFDSGGKVLSPDIVKRAYLDGDRYNADVVRFFDKNGDGQIQAGELILDSPEKVSFISARLVAAGVKEPVISGKLEAYRVNHGIGHEKSVTGDCLSCHSGNSRFGSNVQLASFRPGGAEVISEQVSGSDGLVIHKNGRFHKSGSGLSIVKDGSVKGRYIFGFSSVTWLNALGFIAFILSLAGVAGHAVIRYMAGRGIPGRDVKLVKHKIYPLYERIWHWGMAFSVVMLIITGLEIHFSGSITLFGFDNTIDIHNMFALLVAVNAGLSLFYHVATGEIGQYFSIKRGFRSDAVIQAVYYLYGIFRNSPHPFEKTPEKKLNPLQQVTYVMLLNVLFPVQIITGVMMWVVSVSPAFSKAVGGLTVIAPVHNFFAWLFITFLVVHLYLITTGHTIFSNLKAMVTGYEEIEESADNGGVQEEFRVVKFTDIIDNIRRIARGGKA